MATFNGHIDIVRLLLEKGANTEAQDKVCERGMKRGMERGSEGGT